MKEKMSTSPYSEDLRKRVVEYLKKGKKSIFRLDKGTSVRVSWYILMKVG